MLNLRIRKKTIFYILMLTMYLVPTRISEAFLPYSAYIFYLGQLFFGYLFLRTYGHFRKNAITILFVLFMISGLPGMIINYMSSPLSYLRYVCWFISMLGLFHFFNYAPEYEVCYFLKTARGMFLLSCILTELYGLGGETAIASGFFWGSKAVTTQAWMMFIAISL